MRRHNTKRKARLVKEWQISGERKSDFATRNGIGRSTFYHWTKHLKVSKLLKRTQGFEPIPVDGPAISIDIKPTAIIHYPSGTTLELYTPVDERQLKTLIR